MNQKILMIKVHFRKILQKNSETARTMNVRKSGTANQNPKKKKNCIEVEDNTRTKIGIIHLVPTQNFPKN